MEPSPFNFMPVWMLWTIGIAAFVVALGTINHKLLKPAIQTLRSVDAWLDERKSDHQEVVAMKGDITDIKAMVYPNSGTSLFDKVTKLSKDVKDIKTLLEK